MFVATGFLISCFALVNVAHCTSIKNAEPSQWDCQEDKTSGGGGGLRSNDSPYYTTDKNHTSIELFSSSEDHCSLHLDFLGHSKAPHFEVYQVSKTMLYLRETDAHKRLVSVDMSTCKSNELYKTVDGKRTGVNWEDPHEMIHYDSGVDEIIVENNTRFRVSYDSDGNRIDQPKVFHLEYKPARAMAFSPASRSSNLVVHYFEQGPGVTEVKRFISLVDADGRLIKHLVEFESVAFDGGIEDIGNAFYSYCGGRNGGAECVQFDEVGNETFRKSMKTGDRLLAVFNLKAGGVALFTSTYGRHGTLINAIEMRPDGDVKEKSYALPKDFSGKIVVTDFDEASRQISVRIEGREPPTWESRTCRSTFSLLK